MNSENPFQAPEAPNQPLQPQQLSGADQSDLNEALKSIKAGWIVAIIIGVLTGVVGFIQGHGAWILIDVGLLFGFAAGVFVKSRVAAALLLLYFVVSKILQMMEAGRPAGIIIALVIIFCFYKAFTGTLTYHRITKNNFH